MVSKAEISDLKSALTSLRNSPSAAGICLTVLRLQLAICESELSDLQTALLLSEDVRTNAQISYGNVLILRKLINALGGTQ